MEWFTVASVMTDDLVCGSPGDDFLKLAEHPVWGQLDHIPVRENNRIVSVAQRDESSTSFTIHPLTGDMLICATTPIIDLFKVDWKSSPFFIVIDKTKFRGIVTPSDLNRLPVYSALFARISRFEDAVLRWLDQKEVTDERFAVLGSDAKTWRNAYERLIEAGFDSSRIQVLGIREKLTLLQAEHRRVKILSEEIRAIQELRNSVCHQNPLVTSVCEIEEIQATLVIMDELEKSLDVHCEISPG